MPVRHYLSRLWLAVSLSFYLFAPYCSRFTDANNRFFFGWVRADLFSLVLCILAVGSMFFLCYLFFYRAGQERIRRMSEAAFIVMTGVATVANISCFVKLAPIKSGGFVVALGMTAWLVMGGCIVWFAVKYRRRVKSACMALCFILSALFPVFTLNALRYPSLVSDIGVVPAASNESRLSGGRMKNVYLFIFDEWSYQRSFNGRRLLPQFSHLQQFADQAMVFHSAQAPSTNTATAVPSILYQTGLHFRSGKQIGFQGKEFYPLNHAKSIFHHAKGMGLFTAMIGSAMPFGEILRDTVDLCRSINEYKRFGDDLLGVAQYHLLTTALLLPAPLLHYERTLIADYFFNKFRVLSIGATHDLAATIMKNQGLPTFAVFHYMIPHLPYIFTAEGGHKDFLKVYADNDLPGYYDNLAYTDKMIGEIIATLRAANKYDESLIIFTSDHGWRFDPGYDPNEWRLWALKMRHVPLFIKLPFQNRSVEIDTKFETYQLGNFINRYLDGEFDPAQAERLLREEGSFKPQSLEAGTDNKPGT